MSGLALKDVLADERFDRGIGFGGDEFGGEAAAVVDGGEDGEAVLLAELVVVVAVAGGDVDESGAGVGGDEVGGEDFAGAVEEGVVVDETDEGGTFDKAIRNQASAVYTRFLSPSAPRTTSCPGHPDTARRL